MRGSERFIDRLAENKCRDRVFRAEVPRALAGILPRVINHSAPPGGGRPYPSRRPAIGIEAIRFATAFPAADQPPTCTEHRRRPCLLTRMLGGRA